MKGQRITKDQLAKGLYIKLPLRWHEHPFLRSAFEIQSAEELAVIKRLPVDYILYYPHRSSGNPKTATDVLRNAHQEPEPDHQDVLDLSIQLHQEKQAHIQEMTALRARQSECSQKYKQTLSMLRKGVEEFGREPGRACQEVKSLTSAIVDISGDGPLTLNLVDRPRNDDKLFSHTLNVAILSLIVGRARGYSAQELNHLVTGAFLHDIGLIDVSVPFGADGSLTLSSAAKDKDKHTEFGVRILSDIPDIEKPIINIVGNHHELVDGSGYPRGLYGDELDEMSQIVAIADMYDDLCRPQANGKAYQPSSAVSLLFKKMKQKFRTDLLQHFIKMVGVYPPGSVVQLSDGNAAMVLSNNPESLLKPNVVVFDPMVPRDQAPMISLTSTELTVKQVVKRNSVPQHVYDYLCPSSRFFYFFNSGS